MGGVVMEFDGGGENVDSGRKWKSSHFIGKK
ncbi:hypothetical protein A2U01_0112702, partial [Trifolium medium]|nr:hypothetical protein [Trifolium medium]